jgi:hypothetical protein
MCGVDGVEKLSVVCAAFLEEGIRVDNAAQLFHTGPQLVCVDPLSLSLSCSLTLWVVAARLTLGVDLCVVWMGQRSVIQSLASNSLVRIAWTDRMHRTAVLIVWCNVM